MDHGETCVGIFYWDEKLKPLRDYTSRNATCSDVFSKMCSERLCSVNQCKFDVFDVLY